MRVLVCGGRSYADRRTVWDTLDALLAEHRNLTIIEGAASGADRLAREWTDFRPDVRLIEEPALWDDLSHSDAVIRSHPDGRKYDAKAGTRRNAKMLREYRPHLVIAFPGGSGTRNCVNQAKKLGIQVREIESGG